MSVTIEKNDRNLNGIIQLPPSKSISNRLLIIRALTKIPFNIHNLSHSDDTLALGSALRSPDSVIDIGHAGTSMRFLTAYYAIREGEHLLTGSERMKKRPIGQLVETLTMLGADINYYGEKGYPPLLIKGGNLHGGEVTIDGSISSQFVSALLMIAPLLEEGLILRLENRIVSASYIRLTLELMKYFGIIYEWENNIIRISNQTYQPRDITVEADWSGASYWYEMAALSDNADLSITGLLSDSFQGDAMIDSIFSRFGVITEYQQYGIRIHSSKTNLKNFEFDFTENPDMVQTFAVLCGLKGIPFRFTGTETLKIKETDRIKALIYELSRFGIHSTSNKEGSWLYSSGQRSSMHSTIVTIDTYQDHRMAMAFAPAAITGLKIVIREPEVVNKSYPGFWEDLKKVGFNLSFK